MMKFIYIKSLATLHVVDLNAIERKPRELDAITHTQTDSRTKNVIYVNIPFFT